MIIKYIKYGVLFKETKSACCTELGGHQAMLLTSVTVYTLLTANPP